MRISDWSSDVCSSDLPLAGKNDGKILQLDVRDPSHDGLLVADLALRHLAGAADRKPFAHRHRTGAGNQSRSSCKENRAFFRGGASQDRKSVVSGKSVSLRVDLVGCRMLKKQTEITLLTTYLVN